MSNLNYCFLTFFLYIITVKSCFGSINNYNNNISTFIINGAEDDISSAPYLVSLRFKKSAAAPYEHRCGGVILSSSIVLTTATCVIGWQPQQIYVVAGTSYRTQMDGYIYPVKSFVIHPDFVIWITNNDLALVNLAIDLTTSRPKIIAPIALANNLPTAGTTSKIAGWGLTDTEDESDSTFSELLQLASVEIVSADSCKQSYGTDRITDSMICATAEESESETYIDACLGDAGGPLVVNEELVGIVSWGSDCGRKNFPGVYTNIVYFKDWIQSTSAGF